MIYTQEGIRHSNIKLLKINKDLITALEDMHPEVVPHGADVKKYKHTKARYFISGEFKQNEDETYTRNNTNLLYRDYAVLDVEDTGLTNEELTQLFNDKLAMFNYCYYPSISHTEDNPRYRIVLELDRNANEGEYKQLVLELYNYLGVKGDITAGTYSQLQGLPIANQSNKDSYKITCNKGKPYPVQTVDSNKNIDNNIAFNSYNFNVSSNETLPHETAILLFSKYLEVDRNNLETDYNNSLTVILTLAKAVITNEIEYHTAIECSEMLAIGNVDYIQGNIEKLNNEILKGEDNIKYFKNTYSFRNKIKAPIQNAENNQARKDLINCWRDVYNITASDVFNDIDINNYDLPFKNMKELFNRLYEAGEQWRIENTELKKDGTETTPIMSFTVISSYIRKYLPVVLIGFSEDESNLYYYDYGQGIYINSLHNIKKMISTLENRFNPLKYNQVIEHLKTKTNFTNQLANSKLIACNNGIFNLETKELEPFNPKYYLTSKLDTNYNANEEIDYNNNYRSIFDVDKWIMSIANQDTEINTLLWQIMNESINPNYTRRKIGIMVGEGQNGKGTYQEFLTALTGRPKVANLKPQQFSDRFSKSQLVGKVINIGDDISDSYIDEADDLKSIASGDAITIDRKNKEPLSFSFKLFLLFSANNLPKVSDKSKAFLDRLLLIPFNADFSGQEKDVNIKEVHIKNKYVLEYALYKAVHLDFTHFIEPLAVKKLLEEYKENNDTVYSYAINEYIPLGLNYIDAVPTNYINQHYKMYCENINVKPRCNISKELVKHLNRDENIFGYTYEVKNIRMNYNQKSEFQETAQAGNFCKDYPQTAIVIKK